MRYIQNKISGAARPQTALVLSKQEWGSLQRQIQETRILKELKEEKTLLEQEKRERSRKMTENWPNTLASMQKQRELQLMEAAQKSADKKLKEYNDILQKRKKENEEIIEKARKIVYERNESSRRITSGLVLSAILDERAKQIAMKQEKSQKMNVQSKEDAVKRREMADAYHKEVEERKLKRVEQMQRNKQILDEQMHEILRRQKDEDEEKMREKQDMDDITRELQELRENEQRERNERKKKLKEEQERWGALNAELKDKRRQQDLEEEQLNAIYQTVRDKLDNQRKEMESKMRQEVIERRSKVPTYQRPQLVDPTHEEELLKKALEEQAEQLKKEQQERAEKKERLRRELIAYEEEAKIKAHEEVQRNLELRRWEMLQRLALEEADRKWRETQENEKLRNQRMVREALCQQWQERERKERDERWDDMTVYERAKAEEQNVLLRYCADIEKTAWESGLPMYPVLAAIKSVKKSAGLPEENRKIKFLQSRVPIRSVALYENYQ